VSLGKSKIAIRTRHSAPELSSWQRGEVDGLITEADMQGEEITFIGKRWRSITTLAWAALICAVGITALAFDHRIVGILLLLGAAAPAFTSLRAALFPQSRYIRIDPSGFEVRTPGGRVRVAWKEVAGFRWGVRNDAHVIEVLYVLKYARRSCIVDDERFASSIFDRYNAPLPEVLARLVEWQQRYGHATTPSVQQRTA
jgi:hypothetical protein